MRHSGPRLELLLAIYNQHSKMFSCIVNAQRHSMTRVFAACVCFRVLSVYPIHVLLKQKRCVTMVFLSLSLQHEDVGRVPAGKVTC